MIGRVAVDVGEDARAKTDAKLLAPDVPSPVEGFSAAGSIICGY